jgi:hypothetical protein
MSKRRKKVADFELLQRRVAEAHWRWKVWKQLFVPDPGVPNDAAQRLALMNSVAPALFAMMHRVLFADVILCLCKLADPKDSRVRGGIRDNLTIKAARQRAAARLTSREQRVIDRRIAALDKTIMPFKLWRDRSVAHDDHLTALGLASLPRLAGKKVERVLELVREVMVRLDPNSKTVDYSYDDSIALGDGTSLLDALRCAERYRKKCLAQGRRPPSLP